MLTRDSPSAAEINPPSQVGVDVAIDTKQQTMGSVAFPISSEAIDQIAGLAKGRCNYVQLSIGKPVAGLGCPPAFLPDRDSAAETLQRACFGIGKKLFGPAQCTYMGSC